MVEQDSHKPPFSSDGVYLRRNAEGLPPTHFIRPLLLLEPVNDITQRAVSPRMLVIFEPLCLHLCKFELWPLQL